jgi:hypothetical protein
MAYVRNRLLAVSAYEENGTTMSLAGQGARKRSNVDSLGTRTGADRSMVVHSAYAKRVHRAGCS